MGFFKDISIRAKETLAPTFDSVTKYFDTDLDEKVSLKEVAQKGAQLFGPLKREKETKTFLEKQKQEKGTLTFRDRFEAQRIPSVGGIKGKVAEEVFIKPALRAAAGTVLSAKVPQQKIGGRIQPTPLRASLFGKGVTEEEEGEVFGFQQQISRAAEGKGMAGQASEFLAQKTGLPPKTFAVPLILGIAVTDLFPENPLKATKALKEASFLRSLETKFGVQAVEIAKALRMGKRLEGVEPSLLADVVKEIDSFASPVAREGKTGGQVLEEFHNKIKYEEPTKEETILNRLSSAARGIQQKVVSQYAPLDRLQGKVLKEAGIQALPKVSLAEEAEQLAGLVGKQHLQQIRFDEEVVKPVKDVYKEFNDYLALRRSLSRVESGREEARVGGYTKEELVGALQSLRSKIGEETFARIERSANVMQQKAKEALGWLQDAEVLSPKARQRIAQSADFYAPFRVLQNLSQEVDDSVKASRSLQVKEKELLQYLKGIEDEDFEIFDVAASMAGYLARVKAVAEKNKFMQGFKALAQTDPMGEHIFKITGPEILLRKKELAKALALNKPFRDGLERLTKRFEGLSRDLQRELIRLNKEAVKAATRRVKKTEKEIPTTERARIREFLKSLIIQPKSEVEKLKRKIAVREPKLKNALEELEILHSHFEEVKRVRKGKFDEIRALVDIEQAAKKEAAALGKESISFFEQGEKAFYAVDPDVAQAVKGLNQTHFNTIMRVMDYSSRPFKFGALTANVAFQAINFTLADMMSNIFLNKFVSAHQIPRLVLWDYPRAMLASVSLVAPKVTPNSLAREFLDSGAAASTIARVMRPEAFAKKQLGTSLFKQVSSIPTTTAARLGDVLESSGKIAGFIQGKRAVVRGVVTPQEMITEVRRYAGSPDFARRGAMSPGINLVFMFFNARLQGVLRDLKRLSPVTTRLETTKLNKDSAQAWFKISAGILTPAAALMMYNLRDENREDYEKVSQHERDNFFMIAKSILYGKEDPRSWFTNEDGTRVRDYWKIQKREFVKMLANTTEDFVRFAFDKDPRAVLDASYGFIEGISPINIEGKTLKERGLSVVSSTFPVAKVGVEAVFGKSTFTKRDIYPEYINGVKTQEILLTHPELVYKDSTPDLYIEMGKQLKISPLLLQHVSEGLTGGGSQIIAPKKGGKGVREAEVTGFLGRLRGRFVRSPYLEQTEEEKQLSELAKQATSEAAVGRLTNKQAAKAIFNALMGAKTTEEVLTATEGMTPEIKKELTKKIEQQAYGLDFTDRQLQALPSNEAKARFILSNIERFETQEEANEFFAKMERLEMLTDGVKKEMKRLLKKTQ